MSCKVFISAFPGQRHQSFDRQSFIHGLGRDEDGRLSCPLNKKLRDLRRLRMENVAQRKAAAWKRQSVILYFPIAENHLFPTGGRGKRKNVNDFLYLAMP